MTDDEIDQVFRFGSPIEIRLRDGRTKLKRTTAPTPEKVRFWTSLRPKLASRGVSYGPKWRGGPGEMEFSWWTDPPETLAIERKRALELSQAADSDFDCPMGGGIVLRGYQRAGVEYFSSRKSVLLGDEPGVGKTMQVVGWINQNPNWQDILIICPRNVRLVWVKELERGLLNKLSIGMAEKGIFPSSRVVLLHYDVAHKFEEKLSSRLWDLVVLDEAHLLRNRNARRTRVILGSRANSEKGWEASSGVSGKHRICLTGTPLANEPMDLYPFLRWLDRLYWGSYTNFFRRYGITRDYHGELHRRLREWGMLRRLKREVIKDLPPKVRQVVVAPPTTKEQLQVIERDRSLLSGRMGDFARILSQDDFATAMLGFLKVGIAEIAKIRHDTAMAILDEGVEFVQNLLDQGQKVVCFCIHRDVVEAITSRFKDYGAVHAYGGMKADTVETNVQRFAKNPECRVFVGSVLSVGTGVDGLQEGASTAVFFEDDWVPGNMTQAEDRLHRMGQRDSVTAYHLALEGSISIHVLNTCIRKQAMADKILDNKDSPIAEEEERPYPSLFGKRRAR